MSIWRVHLRFARRMTARTAALLVHWLATREVRMRASVSKVSAASGTDASTAFRPGVAKVKLPSSYATWPVAAAIPATNVSPA